MSILLKSVVISKIKHYRKVSLNSGFLYETSALILDQPRTEGRVKTLGTRLILDTITDVDAY